MFKKILLGIFVLLSIGWFLPGSKTTTASTPVDPQFKCLSSWDGSYDSLKRYTKKNLKDPKSFDHRETRITKIFDGHQMVFMKYGAKNSFGGIVVETIGARIRNSDCKLISIV